MKHTGSREPEDTSFRLFFEKSVFFRKFRLTTCAFRGNMATTTGKATRNQGQGQEARKETTMKITKKAIKEAATYCIAIDYLTGSESEKNRRMSDWGNTHWNFKAMKASNLMDALTEAETYHTEDTYMIHLFEKTGSLNENGIEYKPILASRTKGNWHRHDNQHSESQPEEFTFGFADGWYELA